MRTYYVFDRCIENTVTVRAAVYTSGPYHSRFVIKKGVRRKVDFTNPRDVCRNCTHLNTDRCPKDRAPRAERQLVKKERRRGEVVLRHPEGRFVKKAPGLIEFRSDRRRKRVKKGR